MYYTELFGTGVTMNKSLFAQIWKSELFFGGAVFGAALGTAIMYVIMIGERIGNNYFFEAGVVLACVSIGYRGYRIAHRGLPITAGHINEQHESSRETISLKKSGYAYLTLGIISMVIAQLCWWFVSKIYASDHSSGSLAAAVWFAAFPTIFGFIMICKGMLRIHPKK